MNFTLGDVIGKGGSSTVYKAVLNDDSKTIAVKQIETEGLSREQIRSIQGEIDLLRDVSHTNIVSYLGTQQVGNKIYLLLEFADGGSLRQYYQRRGKLLEPQAAACTEQILQGLKYLHTNGIAHRDIKCANCLLNKIGALKLADFGASKRLESESILSGLKGTPHWMAPEVIKGTQMSTGWIKADVWSLGCTVVEMATGKLPFAEYDNPMTAMYRIANGEAPPMDDLSAENMKELRGFVTACCSADPQERPSVDELLMLPFITRVRKPIMTTNSEGAEGEASDIQVSDECSDDIQIPLEMEPYQSLDFQGDGMEGDKAALTGKAMEEVGANISSEDKIIIDTQQQQQQQQQQQLQQQECQLEASTSTYQTRRRLESEETVNLSSTCDQDMPGNEALKGLTNGLDKNIVQQISFEDMVTPTAGTCYRQHTFFPSVSTDTDMASVVVDNNSVVGSSTPKTTTRPSFDERPQKSSQRKKIDKESQQQQKQQQQQQQQEEGDDQNSITNFVEEPEIVLHLPHQNTIKKKKNHQQQQQQQQPSSNDTTKVVSLSSKSIGSSSISSSSISSNSDKSKDGLRISHPSPSYNDSSSTSSSSSENSFMDVNAVVQNTVVVAPVGAKMKNKKYSIQDELSDYLKATEELGIQEFGDNDADASLTASFGGELNERSSISSFNNGMMHHKPHPLTDIGGIFADISSTFSEQSKLDGGGGVGSGSGSGGNGPFSRPTAPLSGDRLRIRTVNGGSINGNADLLERVANSGVAAVRRNAQLEIISNNVGESGMGGHYKQNRRKNNHVGRSKSAGMAAAGGAGAMGMGMGVGVGMIGMHMHNNKQQLPPVSVLYPTHNGDITSTLAATMPNRFIHSAPAVSRSVNLPPIHSLTPTAKQQRGLFNSMNSNHINDGMYAEERGSSMETSECQRQDQLIESLQQGADVDVDEEDGNEN